MIIPPNGGEIPDLTRGEPDASKSGVSPGGLTPDKSGGGLRGNCHRDHRGGRRGRSGCSGATRGRAMEPWGPDDWSAGGVVRNRGREPREDRHDSLKRADHHRQPMWCSHRSRRRSMGAWRRRGPVECGRRRRRGFGRPFETPVDCAPRISALRDGEDPSREIEGAKDRGRESRDGKWGARWRIAWNSPRHPRRRRGVIGWLDGQCPSWWKGRPGDESDVSPVGGSLRKLGLVGWGTAHRANLPRPPRAACPPRRNDARTPEARGRHGRG